MKRFGMALLPAVLLALFLAGCGGVSGSGGGSGTVTKALLDGGGTTSGAGVTSKQWRIVAIAGNHNYPATSGDQPCPAVLTDPNDSSETLECGSNDIVRISSDGTFSFKGVGQTWTLSGSQVSLNFGSFFGVQVSEVTPETVNGLQRLRIMQISLTRNGTADDHDNGAVLILEEVAI